MQVNDPEVRYAQPEDMNASFKRDRVAVAVAAKLPLRSDASSKWIYLEAGRPPSEIPP
jgi:hypothetical protein